MASRERPVERETTEIAPDLGIDHPRERHGRIEGGR
jgi:hypothetical protein